MRGISWLAAKPVSFSRTTLLHGLSKKVFTTLRGNLLPFVTWIWRQSIPLRYAAMLLPNCNVSSTINQCGYQTISQNITASNNLRAFTMRSIYGLLSLHVMWNKSSNLSEESTLSSGSKSCSGGCWSRWQGNNVPLCAHSSLLALKRASEPLPLAPITSVCLLPQLCLVRGSPNYHI